MKDTVEQRTLRIAAWDLAAATCAVMVLGVMALSSQLYLLLPVILLSAVIRWRFSAGGSGEMIISAMAVAVGLLLAKDAGVRNAGGVLAPVAAEVLLAALFLMVIRLYLRNPRGGNMATLTIGLLAVTAAGSATLGWPYPALATLFLITGLHALRAHDHARTQPRFPSLRSLLPGAAFLLLSAACATGMSLALPTVYSFATERFVDWVRIDPPKIGFTAGSMSLGSMEGMWESDEIVLRLHGDARGALLRGSVHTDYNSGRWAEERPTGITPAGLAGPEARSATNPGDLESTVLVQRVDTGKGPLFLPLGARPVPQPDALLGMDDLGLLHSISTHHPGAYRYRRSGMGSAPRPPGLQDLDVPAELLPALQKLATDWTSAADTPTEKLHTLVQRLELDFVYSQHYQRTPGRDPMLDFLLRDRQGHCEYFASALALLARSIGLPARVIRGYRVRERSPLLNYYVVRESNAHAWAEVYVDGQWTAHDPKPLRSTEPAPSPSMSMVGAVLDALRYQMGRMYILAKEHADRAIGTAFLCIGLFWLAPRIRRWWNFRRPHGRSVQSANQPGTQSLPAMTRVLQLLARHGLVRADHETVEHFAMRLETEIDNTTGAATANALRRYAAFRYGGQGSAADMEAELASASRNLQAGS